MQTELFRKSALQELNSPEQLEQLMVVTRPRAWIALGAIGLILGAVVIWAIWGTLPTKVSGQGIILRAGGIFDVVSQGSGVITDIRDLRVGDKVNKGEVLGHIAQPVLEQQIKAAEADLRSMGGETSARDLSQARERLDELKLRYELAANIVSQETGQVVEKMAMRGDNVTSGQPILSVESGERNLEAVIYLPPASNARRLKPGMAAQISLATAKKQRYGYLIGKVEIVSKYPSTVQGMMAVLENERLVQEMSKSGPPISVLVTLIIDPATKSGYRWSSNAGASLDLSSGTLTTADIVVEENRPISLIIPQLKAAIGL